MRDTLRLKKRTYRHSPWYLAAPVVTGMVKPVMVLRRYGRWFYQKHPTYIKTGSVAAVRGIDFSDADTREARAYYGQPFAPRSDRRRGSY